MKTHKANTINLERFFEITEEKLLESGYITKINNKEFVLRKLSGALYGILGKNLAEEINVCFNVYLEHHNLFTAFFSCNRKTNSFNCSFNTYSGQYSSDISDSFIEVAIRVSSNDIKHIDSKVHEIKNIFRKYYISFYETPYYYYVNSVSTSVNTAFHLDIELKRIII
jgi:hypothetical protein